MWGALTDWVEYKPEEKPKAEAAMMRATKEWLAIDQGSQTAYFDRWLYEELGYARPNQ